MASPFPGMDPYLENPRLWKGLHTHLISSLDTDLNAVLPENYVANIEERVYVEPIKRDLYPDAYVKKKHRRRPLNGASTAVALADPPWHLRLDPKEVHEQYLQIVDLTDKRRIVTGIEVLSPGNKQSDTSARRRYLRKQRAVLRSSTHLVEIDLLRRGEHTIAAPESDLNERGEWDYAVCLARADRRRDRQVWGIRMNDRLPRVFVPLAGRDPDVVLDLRRVFDKAYDSGAYERKVDYRLEPAVPLNPAQHKWADKLLRKRGLRP